MPPPRRDVHQEATQKALMAQVTEGKAERTLCLRLCVHPCRPRHGTAVGDAACEAEALRRARAVVSYFREQGDEQGDFDVIRPPPGGYRRGPSYIWSRGNAAREIPVEVVFPRAADALRVYRALEDASRSTSSRNYASRGSDISPSFERSAVPQLQCLTEFCFEPSKRDYFWPFIEKGVRSQLKLDEEATYSVTEQGTSDIISAWACVLLGVWPLPEALPINSGIGSTSSHDGRPGLESSDAGNSPAYPFVITDATACVGGNTLSFAQYFHAVRAFEIDADRCKLLQANVTMLGLENRVSCFPTNWYLSLEGESPGLQDAVFLDPPWGGNDYRSAQSVPVTLGPTPMLDCIQDLRKYQPRTRLVILKLPLNADLSQFERWAGDGITGAKCFMSKVTLPKILLLVLDFASSRSEFLERVSRCITTGRDTSPQLRPKTPPATFRKWELFELGQQGGHWVDATRHDAWDNFRTKLSVPGFLNVREPRIPLFADEVLLLRKHQAFGDNPRAQGPLRRISLSIVPRLLKTPQFVKFWEPRRVCDLRSRLRRLSSEVSVVHHVKDTSRLNLDIFRNVAGQDVCDSVSSAVCGVASLLSRAITLPANGPRVPTLHICDRADATPIRALFSDRTSHEIYCEAEDVPLEASAKEAGIQYLKGSTIKEGYLALVEAAPKCEVFTATQSVFLELEGRSGSSSAERARPFSTEALFGVAACGALCLGVGDGSPNSEESSRRTMLLRIRSLSDYHMCELMWLICLSFESVSVGLPDHMNIAIPELFVTATSPRTSNIEIRGILRAILEMSVTWRSDSDSLVARSEITEEFVDLYSRAATLMAELREVAANRSHELSAAADVVLDEHQTQASEMILQRASDTQADDSQLKRSRDSELSDSDSTTPKRPKASDDGTA